MKKKIIKILVVLNIFLFVSLFYTPIDYPKNLKDIKKIYLYDINDNLIETYYNNSNIDWINLDNISNIFLSSLLKIEDNDFYNHNGFETLRIFKAIFNNISHKKIIEGASTITQQLVKNLFFQNKKTLIRKIKELLISIKFEKKYSKQEILESYLNIIYFGNGQYGIKNAANFYFSKDPIYLDETESIILINLINNPSKYDPIKNIENSNIKKNTTANYLYKNKLIDLNVLNKIEKTDIKNKLKINNNKKTINHYNNYVVDKIKNIIKEKKLINYNFDVFTNVDTLLQNQLLNEIKIKNTSANTSIICIMPYTYKVIAMQGGEDYLNRSIKSKRQIGSTVKPFLYYLALENNITIKNTFTSKLLNFTYQNKEYEIHNFNNIYHDKINMAYALSVSDNIYAVKMLLYLGINNFYNLLTNLNFSSNQNKTPLLALGISETTLLNLVKSYNIFASEGLINNISFINKIYLNNEQIYKEKKSEHQFFSKKTSFIITDLLKNTFDENIKYSTASNINNLLDNKTYYGKSGLTDFDSYFIGYNKNLTIGVWTGYDDNKPLKTNEDLFNSKSIWARLMNYYQKNLSDIKYDTPKGLIKEKILIYDNYYKDIYISDNLLYY